MKILSEENLERVKNWSWKVQAKKYGEFFNKNLK